MRSSTRIFAASCLLSLLGSPAVFADPAVSRVQGEFNTGSTVVISGSDFGSKATAAPLVFDNFESGTVGAAIAGKRPTVASISSGWVWDENSITERPLYSSSQLRTNSTRNARLHFIGGSYNNSLEIFYDRPNSGDEAYFSFWYYYEKVSGSYSRNHKPWVVYGNNGGYYPSAYDGWGNPSAGDGDLRNSVQDTGTTGKTMYGGPSMSSLGGKWRRFEGYLRQSNPGTANGAFQLWSHDPSGGSTVQLIQSNTAYITRSSSNYWRQWHFGSYHDNLSTGAEANVYLDDVYFDNTRARVELGDASTWAACKRREIQPATSWSSSSVQVSFNKGSFASGSTAYIYVVDSQGVVNSTGTAITIGGGAAVASPPMPPANFRVEEM